MTDTIQGADSTVWQRSTTGPALDPQTIIHVDEVGQAIRPSTSTSSVELFPLTGDACDLACLMFRFPPNYVGTRHSHPADTVYIVRKGVFNVEGEGAYHVGDIRWVKANTVYGPETAGPEGCEVFLIAHGKFPLPTNRAD